MRILLAALCLSVLGSDTVIGQGATDRVLNRLAAELAAAFNAQDAMKVAAFYAEDAMLMPPNAPPLKGRAAIQGYFEALFKEGTTDLRLLPIASERIDGQYAFEAGTSSVQERKGGAVRRQGKYLSVLKSIRGEWKITYNIFNDDQS